MPAVLHCSIPLHVRKACIPARWFAPPHPHQRKPLLLPAEGASQRRSCSCSLHGSTCWRRLGWQLVTGRPRSGNPGKMSVAALPACALAGSLQARALAEPWCCSATRCLGCSGQRSGSGSGTRATKSDRGCGALLPAHHTALPQSFEVLPEHWVQEQAVLIHLPGGNFVTAITA